MLLHLDENYSDDRGGGENYFLSLPEKIIFHLLTHPLPVFDANKFKKLFFGAKFFDSGGVLPRKKAGKVRAAISAMRVCACVCM